MDMDRTDRIMMILSDDGLTLEEALAFRLSLQDYDDAAQILELQLELGRVTAPARPSVRQAVEAYLRSLGEP